MDKKPIALRFITPAIIKRLAILSACSLLFALFGQASSSTPVYRQPDQSLEARVQNLVSQLILEEIVQQRTYSDPANPRLNVPAYNGWNEALHGVGRSETATVFTQAIGQATTINDSPAQEVTLVISTEAGQSYSIRRADFLDA